MDMSETELKNFIINEDHVFSMSPDEFAKEFPEKFRKHASVGHLYHAIQHKKSDMIEKVEENIKEAATKVSDCDGDDVDAKFVLKMIDRLTVNLSKDAETLDESISESKSAFLRYVNYLESRAKVVSEESRAPPATLNDEDMEFQSHLDVLSYNG